MQKHNHNFSDKKEKIDFKALKKIIRYCKPFFPAIIVSLLLASFGAITTIIGPNKISDLF